MNSTNINSQAACEHVPGHAAREFTPKDIKGILKANREGNEAEARRIVESKNLIWLDSLVEKSQLGL
jgi:hypothetical protein